MIIYVNTNIYVNTHQIVESVLESSWTEKKIYNFNNICSAGEFCSYFISC